MGLYDGIKDLANVVQKADNIDLYKKLLDLGSQALDMQNELFEAKKHIQELEMEIQKKRNIVRHKEGLYITIDGDEDIHYCSTCWGNSGKLIQLTEDDRCVECDRNWRAAMK